MSTGEQMFTAIFVAFLGSGIINLLLNRHYAQKARACSKEDAIGNGIQCLLRDRIMHLCRSYQAAGWCSQDEKVSLQKMYSSYAALGGNDVAHSEYIKVLNLPSVKEKEDEP